MAEEAGRAREPEDLARLNPRRGVVRGLGESRDALRREAAGFLTPAEQEATS